MVQWLRLGPFTARAKVQNLVAELKISQSAWCDEERIKDLNRRAKIIKLLEENIGVIFMTVDLAMVS